MRIDSAEHFTLKDGKINAIINANYTYGKKLRGKAIISVKDTYKFGGGGCFGFGQGAGGGRNRSLFGSKRPNEDGNNDQESSLVSRTIDIDGRAAVDFDIKNELKFDIDQENSKFHDSKDFLITVKVVEDLTGW